MIRRRCQGCRDAGIESTNSGTPSKNLAMVLLLLGLLLEPPRND